MSSATLPPTLPWTTLSRLPAGSLREYNLCPGVYKLRSQATGELLYVGSSYLLGLRLTSYIRRGSRHTARIHDALFRSPNDERVQLQLEPHPDPRKREAQILRLHRRRFGRLPSLNQRQPRTRRPRGPRPA